MRSGCRFDREGAERCADRSDPMAPTYIALAYDAVMHDDQNMLNDPRNPNDWLRPPVESEGALRYLDTIRERWWIVVLTTVLALVAAGAYVALAPKRYHAEADVLVTAFPNETAYAGLGLITESNEPTQTVSTAARLVSSLPIAITATQERNLSMSPQELLASISVEPIAQSSLIAVQAESGTGLSAQRLADGYAQAAVRYETAQLHNTIESLLPTLRSRRESEPVAERNGAGTLGQRIAELEGLLSSPYPSLRIATLATEPTSPASPRKSLALAAGLIGGLLVGLGAAFASQALDPRLRREAQLRRLFRLPILAWIPRVPVQKGNSGPLPSRKLAPGAIEAYRTLRATLSATVGEDYKSILITSSSASEGKTTTAINLAEALATAGHRVLLIEGDLRRPTIARTIGVTPTVGIEAVLVNDAKMQDAITHVPRYGDNLGFLIVAGSSASLADRLSLPTARKLVSEAESLADYVVIDSPPLTEVVDALPIAQEVDAVVMVVRINTSSLSRLTNLGNMLRHGGVRPAGIVVIARERAVETPYYVGHSETDTTSNKQSPSSKEAPLSRPAHSRWS